MLFRSASWGTLVNPNVVNGIYYVGALGGAGTSNWILVRATDTDDNTELTGGTFCFVEEGTTYADSGWVCSNDTTNYGPIQYGLDNANTGAISFTQFSGAQTLVAGQGLTKVGTTIGANANITNYGPVSLLPNSGSGYSAFSIGGYVSGIAGTSYTATLRVGTGNTYGVGTANIVLNHTGFSMAGGTNVTYNINAVDAASFQALVARDPGFIFAVSEQGRRGGREGRQADEAGRRRQDPAPGPRRQLRRPEVRAGLGDRAPGQREDRADRHRPGEAQGPGLEGGAHAGRPGRRQPVHQDPSEVQEPVGGHAAQPGREGRPVDRGVRHQQPRQEARDARSEEHTSELQSH